MWAPGQPFSSCSRQYSTLQKTISQRLYLYSPAYFWPHTAAALLWGWPSSLCSEPTCWCLLLQHHQIPNQGPRKLCQPACTRKAGPRHLCLYFLLCLKEIMMRWKGRKYSSGLSAEIQTQSPCLSPGMMNFAIGEFQRGKQTSVFLHKRPLGTSQQEGSQDLVNNNKM